jgi:hypothetical protein
MVLSSSKYSTPCTWLLILVYPLVEFTVRVPCTRTPAETLNSRLLCYTGMSGNSDESTNNHDTTFITITGNGCIVTAIRDWVTRRDLE